MNNEPDYKDNLAFDPHKQELLSQIANMELRDQLEAKDEIIKKMKNILKECRDVCEFAKAITNKHKWQNEVIAKIDEVLK